MTDVDTQEQIDNLKTLGAIGLVVGIIGWFTPRSNGATIVQTGSAGGSSTTPSIHRNTSDIPMFSQVNADVSNVLLTANLDPCDRTHVITASINEAIPALTKLFRVTFGNPYDLPPSVDIMDWTQSNPGLGGLYPVVEGMSPSNWYDIYTRAGIGADTAAVFNVVVTPRVENFD